MNDITRNNELYYEIEYEDGYIKYVSFEDNQKIKKQDEKILLFIENNLKHFSKILLTCFLYTSLLTSFNKPVYAKNKENSISISSSPFFKDWGFGRSFDYRPSSFRLEKKYQAKKSNGRSFWYSQEDLNCYLLKFTPFRCFIESYERECYDKQKFVFYRMRKYTFKKDTYIIKEVKTVWIREPLSLEIREAIYPDTRNYIMKEEKIISFIEKKRPVLREKKKKKIEIEIIFENKDIN